MKVVVFPLNGESTWSNSILDFAEQINTPSVKYTKTIGMIAGWGNQQGIVFEVEENMPKAQFLELISFDGDACLLSDTGISEYK